MRIRLLVAALGLLAATPALPQDAAEVEDAARDVESPGVALVAPKADQVSAGHLLRRIGFGPNPTEMRIVQRIGLPAYINQQLYPARINDTAAIARLPRIPRDLYDSPAWQARWYTRMVYSRRQLQEKMTLTWHEHFATSAEKVRIGFLMHLQEDFLRKNSLGTFRDLLRGITRDQAMLIWLDNDYNNGNATDDQGNRVLPNRNYARELLQVFSTGPVMLNMDGTPVLDASGVPVPAYSEDDVTELARALTGWHVDYHHRYRGAVFEAGLHDAGDKTLMGQTIQGRTGRFGALEVEDAVDILMAHPSMPPFISKILIQKLSTETPRPDYVARVASVFQSTHGDMRATVRAILTDPEFTDPANVRSQFKTPIEHFVGMVRALGGTTRGNALIDWTTFTRHQVYYPPSVFSFYPPGKKGALVNAANLSYRDSFSDDFVTWKGDTGFDAHRLILRNRLTTPDAIVDFVGNSLLAAPLSTEVRNELLAYMGGQADERKLRGAVWLVLCSPDFQRN